MCGICGELRLDGSRPELADIDRMMQKLERRGPDHDGSYADGPLALGHRRLSIIDLTERANQPMVDAELGLAIVFNGTIYNYPELREELKEFVLNGASALELKREAMRLGMQTLRQSALGMFSKGITTLGEVLRVSTADH